MATAQLLTTKQRTGEYAPKSKPCGGCNKAAAAAAAAAQVPAVRKLPTSDALQFVWVYWHGGAALDELRWSIRSVQKHYHGAAQITIVGSNPPWWNGHHIPQARQVRGKGFERGLSDMLAKMHTISRHPDINSEFVWMMDDVFMVSPCTREELATPRAAGSITPSDHNRWSKIKTKTAQRLQAMGLPCRDFATHLPHFVHKDQLQQLFQTWNPLKESFLWEVAYGNTFHPQPSNHTPWLRRISKPATADQYNAWARRSHFFNLMDKAWCVPMRDWLDDQFGEWHPHEVGLMMAKGHK